MQTVQSPTRQPPSPERAERLQNILARRGVASRRHAADMIRAGTVRVNGKVIREPGWRADAAADRILVAGEPLAAEAPKLRTILMNKPPGAICSADRTQGRSVCELVADLPERLVPVGRLDKESEGLLLLSNDGALVARLTHPRYGHRKYYDVTVAGSCDEGVVARLGAPMELDGRRLLPVAVGVLHRGRGRTVLRFVLQEGRNRQIRRMCALVGLEVVRLVRVGIDTLRLGSLPSGAWRDLTPAERRAFDREK